jgi:hypothetical protein
LLVKSQSDLPSGLPFNESRYSLPLGQSNPWKSMAKEEDDTNQGETSGAFTQFISIRKMLILFAFHDRNFKMIFFV